MEIVKIVCDRCHQEKEGFRTSYGTGGFYEGELWSKYFNPGEKLICDECMWKDARYRADYPACDSDEDEVCLEH